MTAGWSEGKCVRTVSIKLNSLQGSNLPSIVQMLKLNYTGVPLGLRRRPWTTTSPGWVRSGTFAACFLSPLYCLLTVQIHLCWCVLVGKDKYWTWMTNKHCTALRFKSCSLMCACPSARQSLHNAGKVFIVLSHKTSETIWPLKLSQCAWILHPRIWNEHSLF